MRRSGPALLCFSIISAPWAAGAQGLKPEERAAIDERLGKKVELAAKQAVEDGDTLLVERRQTIAAIRVQKKPSEYEGLVIVSGAPKGVVIHPRVDELRLEPAGDKVNIILRYALHVDPGSSGGGKVQLSLNLVERTGLANTVSTDKLTQTLSIVAAKPALQDLTRDFWGYRLYSRIARERMEQLTKKGLRGLSIADNAKIPPLDRVPNELMPLVTDFERARRRTWIAHRHLIAARTSRDERIASAAKAYLANLDKADAELSGLPASSILPGGAQGAAQATAVEPAEKRVDTKGGTGGTRAVTSYDPSSESGDDEPLETPPPPREEPPPEEQPAITPVKPDGPGAGQQVALAAEEPNKLSEDLLEERRVRRQELIPSAPRGLVLDDTNIGHGALTRFTFAKVSRVQGTSALVPAFFYGAETAVLPSLGVELMVPTVYVNLEVNRAQSLYLLGNPLVTAKYRLYIPEVEGRRPVITLRARAGLPIPPRHKVPPTDLVAEQFSWPAHFADTYAFLTEKVDLGLGFSSNYQYSIMSFGLQLYGDYFFPSGEALDQSSFLTFSYGASVGVLPFGDLVGFYAEARATSMFSGPGRTEFFAYLGARTHFLDYLELALWGALPIGSVGEVSGLQLGAEARFAFDLQDSVDLPPSAGATPAATGATRSTP